MIVDDLDLPCLSAAPLKADSPPVIDADAVLAEPVTLQGLEAIAGRNAEVVQSHCRIKGLEFRPCPALESLRKVPDSMASEKRCRALVSETLDHGAKAYRIAVRQSME